MSFQCHWQSFITVRRVFDTFAHQVRRFAHQVRRFAHQVRRFAHQVRRFAHQVRRFLPTKWGASALSVHFGCGPTSIAVFVSSYYPVAQSIFPRIVMINLKTEKRVGHWVVCFGRGLVLQERIFLFSTCDCWVIICWQRDLRRLKTPHKKNKGPVEHEDAPFVNINTSVSVISFSYIRW